MGVRKLPPSHWAVRAEKLFRQSVKEDIEAHKKAGRFVRISRSARASKSVAASALTQKPPSTKSRKNDKRT